MFSNKHGVDLWTETNKIEHDDLVKIVYQRVLTSAQLTAAHAHAHALHQSLTHIGQRAQHRSCRL